MTTLYMTNGAAGLAAPGGTGATYNLAESAPGSGTFVKTTIAGPVTPASDTTRWTLTGGGTLVTWVSPPLTVGVTVSGNITVQVNALESNNMANACFYARAGILSGGVYTWIGNNTNTSEFGTGAGNFSTVIAPASTAFAIGDRLVLETHMDDASGVTMGAGYSLTINAGANSFITTTESLVFTSGVANSLAMMGHGL